MSLFFWKHRDVSIWRLSGIGEGGEKNSNWAAGSFSSSFSLCPAPERTWKESKEHFQKWWHREVPRPRWTSKQEHSPFGPAGHQRYSLKIQQINRVKSAGLTKMILIDILWRVWYSGKHLTKFSKKTNEWKWEIKQLLTSEKRGGKNNMEIKA